MDNFYVGYLPKAPKQLKGWLAKVVVLLMMVGLGTGGFLILNYDKSVNSTFEYGIYKEFTGVVYRTPIPVIKISSGNSPKTLVLVNFGKAGVDDILQTLEDSLGNPLDQYDVTLRGSLIYYDGVTLLEMSESEKSIVAVTQAGPRAVRSQQNLGSIELTGELVDSKCFFGVMKPGFGKIHRSCATRCIAGGVPVGVAGNDGAYYFTPSEGIKNAFQSIGKPVSIRATVYQIDELKYLEVGEIDPLSDLESPDQIALRLLATTPHTDDHITACD